jgi:hypothetical protein
MELRLQLVNLRLQLLSPGTHSEVRKAREPTVKTTTADACDPSSLFFSYSRSGQAASLQQRQKQQKAADGLLDLQQG